MFKIKMLKSFLLATSITLPFLPGIALAQKLGPVVIEDGQPLKLNFYQAKDLCDKLGGRVPTAEDVMQFALMNGARDMRPINRLEENAPPKPEGYDRLWNDNGNGNGIWIYFDYDIKGFQWPVDYTFKTERFWTSTHHASYTNTPFRYIFSCISEDDCDFSDFGGESNTNRNTVRCFYK